MTEFKDNTFVPNQDTELDILEQDFTDTFQKNSTESITEEAEVIDENEPKKPINEGQQSQQQNEEGKKPFMSAKEYEMISELCVEIFDGGASFLMGQISGEKNTKQFELKTDKKYFIKKKLSVIFEKHQTQFISTEFMFLLFLASVYSPMIKETVRLRAVNKEKEKNKNKKTETAKEVQKEEQPINKYGKIEELKEEPKEEENTDSNKIHKVVEKRKHGRPFKNKAKETETITMDIEDHEKGSLNDDLI